MKRLYPLLLILLSLQSQAQLSFPQGTVLNLTTKEELVYLETMIKFHTGQYKSDDYRYEKISDSIDSRWSASACFNGECWNELVDSGTFVRDYGYNDTTGFIAFHVWSKGFNGNSVIKYRVVHKDNVNDQAELTFNVTYFDPLSVNDDLPVNALNLYPNPAAGLVTINNRFTEDAELKVYNETGQLIPCVLLPGNHLDVNEWKSGIYYLIIMDGSIHFTGRLVVI